MSHEWPRDCGLEGVVGTHRRRDDAVPRKRTKHIHPGDDIGTKATTRLRGSLPGEPDEGVLQDDNSFGRCRAKSTARKTESAGVRIKADRFRTRTTRI